MVSKKKAKKKAKGNKLYIVPLTNIWPNVSHLVKTYIHQICVDTGCRLQYLPRVIARENKRKLCFQNAFCMILSDIQQNNTCFFIGYSYRQSARVVDRQKGKTHSSESPVHDTKPSDGMALILELWGMCNIPSLPWLQSLTQSNRTGGGPISGLNRNI